MTKKKKITEIIYFLRCVPGEYGKNAVFNILISQVAIEPFSLKHCVIKVWVYFFVIGAFIFLYTIPTVEHFMELSGDDYKKVVLFLSNILESCFINLRFR